MIGFYDLIVAATALERGSDVATLNRRHFAPVKGLNVIEPRSAPAASCMICAIRFWATVNSCRSPDAEEIRRGAAKAPLLDGPRLAKLSKPTLPPSKSRLMSKSMNPDERET